MGFNSGLTSVTGSVTSVIKPRTTINIHQVGTSSTVNVYQVPAGKKFFLMGMDHNAAADTFTVDKDDGTTSGFQGVSTVSNGFTFSSSVPIWEYAAGEHLVALITNAQRMNFWGYLEDV